MLAARHYLFKFTEAQLNQLVIPGDCVNLIMEYLHWIDLQAYKRYMRICYDEYDLMCGGWYGMNSKINTNFSLYA